MNIGFQNTHDFKSKCIENKNIITLKWKHEYQIKYK